MKFEIKEGGKYIIGYELISGYSDYIQIQHKPIKSQHRIENPFRTEMEIRRELNDRYGNVDPHGNMAMEAGGAIAYGESVKGDRTTSICVVVNDIEKIDTYVYRISLASLYPRYGGHTQYEFIVYDENHISIPLYNHFVTLTKFNASMCQLTEAGEEYHKKLVEITNNLTEAKVRAQYDLDAFYLRDREKKDLIEIQTRKIRNEYGDFLNTMINQHQEKRAYKTEVKNFIDDDVRCKEG